MKQDSDSQFVRFLSQSHSALYSYIYSLHPHAADVDDILQETSASLWKRFGEFDPLKGDFLPWAFRFAYFEVLRFRKQRTRSRMIFDESLLEQLSDTLHQESQVLNHRNQFLQSCITRLPDRDQALLNCRYGPDSNVVSFAKHHKLPVKHLYRELERIRLLLFRCVDRQLNRLGDHA